LKNDLCTNVSDNSAFAAARLEEFKALKHVGDVRIQGMMIGIELVADKESRRPFPYEMRMGHRVIREVRRLGAVLRPLGNVVVLMPPLTIQRPVLDSLLNMAYNGTKSATES
jgi:adenosylmethionine-8-amino-7-oxononanoate aminotransferase